MSRLIDLREHFGIWDRCGNSRFFIKNPANPWAKIFLNPLDGMLATVHRYSEDVPLYELIVRDAKKASDEELKSSFEINKPFPWIERAVRRFFYYQAIGWALDAIREHAGKDPLPGDKDMGNFLAHYEAGGEHYRQEGGSSPGDKPMLEETLQAILRTVTDTKGTISDYGRGLSEQDMEEALAHLGILEC